VLAGFAPTSGRATIPRVDAQEAKAAPWDELTEPEQRVWRSAGTGELVDLRVGAPERDNPTTGATWDTARVVRAEVLADLLVGAYTPPGNGRLRAVRLRGARVTGQLDLEAATLGCPLLLRDCCFEQRVNLREAYAPVVRLPGCHMPGLAAEQLETRGNLELNHGFTATGEVGLVGARVGGWLDLSGATLTNPDGYALAADGITVKQSIFGRGFTATGEVRLLAAHIGLTVDLEGASLTNPNRHALSADGLTVNLAMFCRDGFTATGQVRLLGADIGGQLDLSGAHLVNPGGRALNADGLTVDQSMFCGAGFTVAGEVDLVGAHITGTLDLGGATLTNPSGNALNGARLVVDGDLSCPRGFTATGEVRLVAAHVGGIVELAGAQLMNPSGHALNADGIAVDRAMFCRAGFTATGQVSLVDARIGGPLGFDGASLTEPDGLALNLEGVRAPALFLRPYKAPDGKVSLLNARVGSFLDDQATWPATIELRGFDYDTLDNEQVDVGGRLGWLRRHQGGYNPQVYEQLAAVYRRGGRDQDARTVAIAKQRARRRTLGLPGRLWSLLLDGLVGHGYRTWLAGVWLLGFWLVGWAVFDRAHAHQELVLASPGQAHPGFHGAIYSLDTLLPVVDLRQQAVWIPHGGAQWWAWASILAGWVLTTAVVAGLTGILKRD
jgi:hypothetical protein